MKSFIKVLLVYCSTDRSKKLTKIHFLLLFANWFQHNRCLIYEVFLALLTVIDLIIKFQNLSWFSVIFFIHQNQQSILMVLFLGNIMPWRNFLQQIIPLNNFLYKQVKMKVHFLYKLCSFFILFLRTIFLFQINRNPLKIHSILCFLLYNLLHIFLIIRLNININNTFIQ